jgi:hypothetical protein
MSNYSGTQNLREKKYIFPSNNDEYFRETDKDEKLDDLIVWKGS